MALSPTPLVPPWLPSLRHLEDRVATLHARSAHLEHLVAQRAAIHRWLVLILAAETAVVVAMAGTLLWLLVTTP